jgi:hypothetical protein
MPQKTHYQDDIFLLSVYVKSLEASLAVEADPEYFKDRIIADCQFIDEGIRTFSDMLIQNSHLIERIEYAKLLERTARGFMLCMRHLIDGNLPNPSVWAASASQFRAMMKEEAIVLSSLSELLKSGGEADSETDLVSSDELSELLRE